MKKKRNLTLIIGAVLTAFMLLFLLIGFFYTPYDPDAMNGAAKFAAPQIMESTLRKQEEFFI